MDQFLTEQNRDDWKRRWEAYLAGDKSEHVTMSKTFGLSEGVLSKWKPSMQSDDDGDGGGDSSNVIKLYGPIVDDFWARYFEGMISGAIFEEMLDAAAEDNDEIVIRINSPGGSVIEAALMYDAVSQMRGKGKTVNAHIAGMSASAAASVMMAAGQISISPVGAVFVHNPRVYAYGNASTLRASADTLQKVEDVMKDAYSKRYKDNEEYDDLDALMEGATGDGTWLTPELALTVGFVDSVDEAPDPDDDRDDANASMADRVRASFGNMNGNNGPPSGINPGAITASAQGDQDDMGDQNDQNDQNPDDQNPDGTVATAMQSSGLNELVKLAGFNGIGEQQAGTIAMQIIADGGGAPEMATKLLELPEYHEKYHSRNVEAQKRRQGPVATVDGFLNLVASANPNSGVARSHAEEKHAIEHQWQQDIFEKDGHNLHNMLKSGAGELIPTALFWSGEREVPTALIDTYSARDVMPSRIDFARTMPELVARTPIIKYVTQATERAATVHIPVVTDGPDINNQALGISAGALVSAETTEPDADDMTVTTVVVRPEIFDAIVNIPAVSDILTEGWTQRVAYENIQDKLASDFESRIIKGAQALTTANTAVPITNAVRTGGGKALHREIIKAGSSAFKANVPIRNSAYVFGSDIFDLLLVEPIGAGGGRTIVSGSTEENVNPMIEGELNGGVPAIKSNQLSAGGSANQGAEHQGIYGAWSHCQLTNWAYMRAWLDNNNTRLWKLKFVTLAAVTFIRGPAFTDLTVTTA